MLVLCRKHKKSSYLSYRQFAHKLQVSAATVVVQRQCVADSRSYTDSCCIATSSPVSLCAEWCPVAVKCALWCGDEGVGGNTDLPVGRAATLLSQCPIARCTVLQ